jgi:hypothetical protein
MRSRTKGSGGNRSDLPKTEREREAELRRWIGGQLKQRGRRVPDEVWSELSSSIRDALGPEALRSELLSDARGALLRYRAEQRQRGSRKRRGAKGTPLPSERVASRFFLPKELMDRRETRRTALLARELAWIAEKKTRDDAPQGDPSVRPFVQEIREDFFEGRELSEDEAKAFKQSVAVRLFELEFFREFGIPIGGHTSELIGPQHHDSLLDVTWKSELVIRWGNDGLRTRVRDRVHQGWLRFNAPPLDPFSLKGSLYAHVARAAAQFCRWFPWPEDGALWFILAGHEPTLLPIWCDGFAPHETEESKLVQIHMTIQPWVSLKTVLRAYKRMQRFYFQGRNRPPQEKSLDLFEFVSERRHKDLSWSEILREWKLAHHEARKRYPVKDPNSVRRFSGHYRDVEQQILRPYERAGVSVSRLRPEEIEEES